MTARERLRIRRLAGVLTSALLAAPAFAASPRAVPPVAIDGGPTAGEGGLRTLRGEAPSLREESAPAVLGARRPSLHHSRLLIGGGDFSIRATLLLESHSGRGLGLAFDGGRVELDQPGEAVVLRGTLFGGGSFTVAESRPTALRPGAPFDFMLSRTDGRLVVSLDGIEAGSIGMRDIPLGRLGFSLGGGELRVLACEVEGDLAEMPLPRSIFETPEGDIDEHRDPVLASDGRTALLGAIAVVTRDDGSLVQSLRLRRLDESGELGPAETAGLGELEPELAALGHDGDRWILAVQSRLERGFGTRVELLGSSDGRDFKRLSSLETPPLRLASGSATRLPDGTPAFTATLVGDDGPRPALLERGADGWRLRKLSDEPGGEPVLLGNSRVLFRRAGSLERASLPLADSGTAPATSVTADGFRGAPIAPAAIAPRPGSTAVLQPSPTFPNPMTILVSEDGGARWSGRANLWGGPSGAVDAVAHGDRWLVLFEGGDATRREHVLLAVLEQRDLERVVGSASTGAEPSTGPVSPPPTPQR